MHLIVYISDYVGDPDNIESVINDIVTASKKQNPEHGITGVLFYQSGRFLQIIEGEQPALLRLMKNIGGDQRHRNLVVLLNEQVHGRGFEDWNMDSFNMHDSEQLDPVMLRDVCNAIKASVIPRADNLADVLKEYLGGDYLD